MATQTAPNILHGELRRTPAPRGGSILFEALHEGRVVGQRASGSFDFHAALYYRFGGREWNVYGYYGRPDLLAGAQRKLVLNGFDTGRGELDVLVAVAPSGTSRRQLFNEQYPIGTPVLYHRVKGKPVATFTTGTSWDVVLGEPTVVVELAPAPRLPQPGKAGGYNIDSISPDPTGTPGPPYGTVEALIDLLSRAFHVGLLDHEQRGVVGDFARQVCAHNLVERLRSQLADYLVCQALGARAGSASFLAFTNHPGEILRGLWNTHDYAGSRAAAETQLCQHAHVLAPDAPRPALLRFVTVSPHKHRFEVVLGDQVLATRQSTGVATCHAALLGRPTPDSAWQKLGFYHDEAALSTALATAQLSGMELLLARPTPAP